MTADHDDRVFPAHSFKYAAAMQAAIWSRSQRQAPALIRIETRAGHGGGMPLSKRVEMAVDQYAFIVNALQIKVSLSIPAIGQKGNQSSPPLRQNNYMTIGCKILHTVLVQPLILNPVYFVRKV